MARINDVLTKLETDITGAKAKVDSADPDDPQAFLATITDCREPARADQRAGRARRPQRLPRLQKAAAKAANCQQLSAQGSNPPG